MNLIPGGIFDASRVLRLTHWSDPHTFLVARTSFRAVDADRCSCCHPPGSMLLLIPYAYATSPLA